MWSMLGLTDGDDELGSIQVGQAELNRITEVRFNIDPVTSQGRPSLA